MASYNNIDEHAGDDDVTMRAHTNLAAATKKYVVVVLSSTQGRVELPAAATDIPYGILQTLPANAAVGDPVVVRPIGSGRRSLVNTYPATSIALGDAVSINATDATTGQVDTAAKTYQPIGIVLEASTAQNDLVACQLAGSLIPRA